MADAPKARIHGPLQNYFVFPVARMISWFIMVLFGRATVYGAYRCPKKGGVLILPNHLADVDPLMLQLHCPRNIHFMAKQDLFSIGWLAPLMRMGNTFPVKQGEPDRGALRLAADLLKEGAAVCVFPEGQLSEDGELQPLKPGVALIVRMAQVPVICVGLRKTNKVLPYGKLIPRPTAAKVTSMWGEPRTFPKEATTDEIMEWVEGQLRVLTQE
ncbi:MAG TPA: lysophospholipid acyltransferase family protein [Fimbriimonas sp.]|nr:lysophospholipid acyltransferase family protein [Fimbriimonas sp.]